MVFRRDKQGGDAFQRQISALRQQLGGGQGEEEEFADAAELRPDAPPYNPEGYDAGQYEPGPAVYGREAFQAEYDYPTETAVESIDPQLPAIPIADSQVTVVSHDTSWKGEISSEGSMHIHGRFEGVIKAKDDVFILDEASVAAEVMANNVVISGRYDGEVSCSTRFEVLPSGRVRGSVRAPVLVVHDGAEINGSIQMTSLEAAPKAPTSLLHRREATGSGQ